MNVERNFKLAKNASEFSDCNIKVGSVLIYKNKVISIGWNTNKSNPLMKEYNKYRTNAKRYFDVDKHCNGLHSEIMCLKNAIRAFDGDLSKCSIFIYSETKNGNTRLSRPCNACSKYLNELGIKHIYYTTNNGWQYEKR